MGQASIQTKTIIPTIEIPFKVAYVLKAELYFIDHQQGGEGTTQSYYYSQGANCFETYCYNT